MQTVQHEPSMVPQSTGQKYQNVLPGQIQGTEQQQQYKLHEGLMNPSQPQLPPQFQPHGQYQSSRRIQFQGGDIQINISTESVQLLNQLINLLIKVNSLF